MNILPNDIVYVLNKSSTAIVLCTYGRDIKSSSPYSKHNKTQACLKSPIEGKRYWSINDLNKVV
jgi:hypothetical protein